MLFRDVSYKIPDGATQLVVRFEAASTFFNEIIGIDNVRIHTGALPTTPPTINITRQGAGLTIEFTGVLQRSSTMLAGSWADVPGAASPHLIPAGELVGTKFYRARTP